jgi:hypothetical protein
MPSISTITPATFDSGRSVTLTGEGFGASQGQVLIGGVAQNVNTWSDTSITFTTVRGSQSLGACRVDVVGRSGWQLGTDYWVAAKMPLTIVYPRPDNETSSAARHRNAYADGSVRYEIPIAVQGGAYPFYFELISAPSGMTIGNTIGSADYGVIKWTPTAEGGPYTVSIRVTDQELTAVERTWTISATNSAFIFVDPGVSVSGTGTKASPLKLFSDIHKGSSADSTYAGKIVYLRAGTHTLGGAEANGNYQLASAITPVSWIGYPDETVVVNASASKFIVDAANDVFVADFRMTAARTDVANAHFWFFNSNAAQSRVTFYAMTFDNIGRGTSGTDNPAAITFFNSGLLRNYFALISSSLNDYSSPILDSYAMNLGVIEDITIGTGKTAEVDQGILLKSDISNFSVRRVKSQVQNFTYGAVDLLMQAQIFAYNNVEVSYCALKSSVRTIVYNWTESIGANNNPKVFLYRNTLNCQPKGLDSFLFTVTVEKNIVSDSGGLQTSGTYRVITNTDNILYSSGTTLFDVNGDLTGSAAQYEGQYGHMISGEYNG